MAKKKPEYDVTERFQRVAELAREQNAPKKKKPVVEPVESVHSLRESFRKQFPGSGGIKKDVNLPFVKGPRK